MRKIPVGIIILGAFWAINAVLVGTTAIVCLQEKIEPAGLFKFMLLVAAVEILIAYGLIEGDILAWRAAIFLGIITILLKTAILLLVIPSVPPTQDEYKKMRYRQARYSRIERKSDYPKPSPHGRNKIARAFNIEVGNMFILLGVVGYLLTPTVRRYVGDENHPISLNNR